MSTDTISHASDAPGLGEAGWRLDPQHSSIEFRASTLWGLVKVTGHFERYEGTLDLRRDPAIELTIDAASLTTGIRPRDRHLRSADFFDVASHPHVRFVSESVVPNGETLMVRGRLTAAGSDIPVELEAAVRPAEDGYWIEAATRADQRTLGMSRGLLGMIPAPSELTVRGRLVR